MKRFTQLVCFLLIASLVLAVPAYASESSARASAYFMAYSCYLWKTSDTRFEVWFDVTAVGGMDELGVSVIEVQRSSDKSTWTTMRTYTKDSYSSMVASNTGNHSGCVAYTATSGYYYRAYVQFYAKNSSGSGYYSTYTSSLKM